MDVPTPVRVLALILALMAIGLHGVEGSLALEDGSLIVGSAHIVLALLLAVPMAWIAAVPRRAGRFLDRRVGLDPTQTGEVVGGLIHLVFIYMVFGLTLLNTATLASQFLASGQHPIEGQAIDPVNIVQGLVFNLVLFAVAAFTWLGLVEGRHLLDSAREMGLEPRKFLPGVGWGLAATLGIFVALAILAYTLQILGLAPENPQADAIASALTPALAILVAALAGIGEELYFRGFLLPRTNNWIQAGLFGAIHATYLTAFQVILPFLLGLAFGWLREKTSLWAPIAAHTAFNTIMLLSAIYAGEAEQGFAMLVGWL